VIEGNGGGVARETEIVVRLFIAILGYEAEFGTTRSAGISRSLVMFSHRP